MFARLSVLRLLILAGLVAVGVSLANDRVFAATPSEETAAHVLGAMVGLRISVPPDARSAQTLGAERAGGGVVIDENGLVVTIGYLILEAGRIDIIKADGEAVPAHVVGYDHESGFGLVRAESALGIKPIRLGQSSALAEGDRVLAVSVGPRPVTPGYVVSRKPFAGGWEYLVENAIYTSPPHQNFGGAALINEEGRLVGIGSLYINVALPGAQPLPGNMFVPIDDLKLIFTDMIEHGRRAKGQKPWLGVNTEEAFGRVFVSRVTPGSPAEKAGIKAGDIIMGVGGRRVESMIDFYRKIWTLGEPGIAVPLDVLQQSSDLTIRKVDVPSVSRYDWLNIKRGY